MSTADLFMKPFLWHQNTRLSCPSFSLFRCPHSPCWFIFISLWNVGFLKTSYWISFLFSLHLTLSLDTIFFFNVVKFISLVFQLFCSFNLYIYVYWSFLPKCLMCILNWISDMCHPYSTGLTLPASISYQGQNLWQPLSNTLKLACQWIMAVLPTLYQYL